MAGIYIHIPYCKQACYYCDFHFSTKIDNFQELTNAICKEIVLRKDYLEHEVIATIYFGGGTPSILPSECIKQILEQLHSYHNILNDAEISLEANPEDLSLEKLKELKNIGINRLSIGIQTFNDDKLKWMNRIHDSNASIEAIKKAQAIGFENITADLIYGIPSENNELFLNDLEQMISLGIPHISAYCLTIEEGTVFGKRKKKKTQPLAEEEFEAKQFEILINTLQANGYEQYEISNFAKNEKYSKHNSSYWQQKKYLGLGPSAHSFNGISREANISNNKKYIENISNNKIESFVEHLSDQEKINDYVLTTLRTKWGTNLKVANSILPNYEKIIEEQICELKKQNLILVINDIMYLTNEGKMLADWITEKLILV